MQPVGEPGMNGLLIQDIHKSFGEKRALAGVSFQVEPGECVGVLGPSGCGKSTLLAVVAGLERPDQGEVFWDGLALSGTPAYKRDFGLMFQDYALFPHRNVYENVAFGLQMKGQGSEQIEQRVLETLALAGLPGFERRDVNTLSGGEQQRVALARALAPRPRLLMLDEPLGSLDRTLRQRLVLDLRLILQQTQQTAIYVTHDQEEAFTLADRVVLMNAGRVEQIGSPEAIYRQPASLFVARFLGLDNLLPGQVIEATSQGIRVSTAWGEFHLPVTDRHPGDPLKSGDKISILVRPEAIHLGQDGTLSMSGTLSEASFHGSDYRLTADVQGIEITFEATNTSQLPNPGELLWLSFDPASALQLLRQ